MKRILLFAGLLAGSFIFNSLAQAPAGDSVKITARTATGQWGERQGLQLEGTAAAPARVVHPQLDVAAPKIDVAFDDKRQLKNVTASGGVQFKVSLTQKVGPPVRVEAKCDNALLERGATERVLTLRGGVDGWYQNGDGPRNTLRGQTVKLTSRPDGAETLLAELTGDANGIRVDVPPPGKDVKGGTVTITAQNATLRQVKGAINADLDGAARGVRLEIPAQAKAAAGGLQLGAVVVTAQKASVRQAEGIARFTGNARAVSSDGLAKLDLAADELVLTRSAAGELDSLKTSGRAKVKLVLPPLAVPENDKNPGLKPSYVEVEADAMVALPTTGRLSFDGKVKGFYRMPNPNAKPGEAATADYHFSCDRADVKFVEPPPGQPATQGLDLKLDGNVAINAPALLGEF